MTRTKKPKTHSSTIKLAGVTMKQRWKWLGYRQWVSEWLRKQSAHCYGLPKVGDVKTHAYGRSVSCDNETALIAMRAALALLENRGITDKADSVDVSNLTAVRVTVGTVTHLVNLAPVRACFPALPALVDTFAPGTILCRSTGYKSSGRYYGIMPHETCQDYCERLGLAWPEYHQAHDDDVAEYRKRVRA